jgi:hypothetical protein
MALHLLSDVASGRGDDDPAIGMLIMQLPPLLHVLSMDFMDFLWFIFFIPLFAAIALYSYYERKEDQKKVNRRIQRLEEYDMKRDTTSSTIEIIKVRCPSCNALNPESAKFCNECGAKLTS